MGLGLIFGLIYIVLVVFSFLIRIGTLKFGLRIFDGEKPKIKELWSYTNLFWKCILIGVIFGLAVAVVFLVATGVSLLSMPLLHALSFPLYVVLLTIGSMVLVYLYIKYGFSYFCVVDKNSGVKESFKKSAEMTKGNMWRLLGFWVVFGVINVIGLMVFVVGLLVTVPVSFLAIVVVYRALEGSNLTSPPISI